MEHPESSTPPEGTPTPPSTGRPSYARPATDTHGAPLPTYSTDAPTAATPGAPVPTFSPDAPTAPTAVAPAPALSPAVGYVPEAPRRRRWPMAIAIALVVALAGLSGYLWWVNTLWAEQNSTLRSEALAMGELLAVERELSAQQAAELDNAASELEAVTTRVSDLANEEANAIDDRVILEDIADGLVECADQRQRIIEAYRLGRTFVGISRVGYENELKEYCGELADALDEHYERRDER